MKGNDRSQNFEHYWVSGDSSDGDTSSMSGKCVLGRHVPLGMWCWPDWRMLHPEWVIFKSTPIACTPITQTLYFWCLIWIKNDSRQYWTRTSHPICEPPALPSILLSNINGRWPGALAACSMSRGQDAYKYLVRYRGRRAVCLHSVCSPTLSHYHTQQYKQMQYQFVPTGVITLS